MESSPALMGEAPPVRCWRQSLVLIGAPTRTGVRKCQRP